MLFLSPLSEQMLSPVSEMLAIRHPDYWRYHCNFSYTEEFETVVHLYNAFFFFFFFFPAVTMAVLSKLWCALCCKTRSNQRRKQRLAEKISSPTWDALAWRKVFCSEVRKFVEDMSRNVKLRQDTSIVLAELSKLLELAGNPAAPISSLKWHFKSVKKLVRRMKPRRRRRGQCSSPKQSRASPHISSEEPRPISGEKDLDAKLRDVFACKSFDLRIVKPVEGITASCGMGRERKQRETRKCAGKLFVARSNGFHVDYISKKRRSEKPVLLSVCFNRMRKLPGTCAPAILVLASIESSTRRRLSKCFF